MESKQSAASLCMRNCQDNQHLKLIKEYNIRYDTPYMMHDDAFYRVNNGRRGRRGVYLDARGRL